MLRVRRLRGRLCLRLIELIDVDIWDGLVVYIKHYCTVLGRWDRDIPYFPDRKSLMIMISQTKVLVFCISLPCYTPSVYSMYSKTSLVI